MPYTLENNAIREVSVPFSSDNLRDGTLVGGIAGRPLVIVKNIPIIEEAAQFAWRGVFIGGLLACSGKNFVSTQCR